MLFDRFWFFVFNQLYRKVYVFMQTNIPFWYNHIYHRCINRPSRISSILIVIENGVGCRMPLDRGKSLPIRLMENDLIWKGNWLIDQNDSPTSLSQPCVSRWSRLGSSQGPCHPLKGVIALILFSSFRDQHKILLVKKHD